MTCGGRRGGTRQRSRRLRRVLAPHAAPLHLDRLPPRAAPQAMQKRMALPAGPAHPARRLRVQLASRRGRRRQAPPRRPRHLEHRVHCAGRAWDLPRAHAVQRPAFQRNEARVSARGSKPPLQRSAQPRGRRRTRCRRCARAGERAASGVGRPPAAFPFPTAKTPERVQVGRDRAPTPPSESAMRDAPARGAVFRDPTHHSSARGMGLARAQPSRPVR